VRSWAAAGRIIDVTPELAAAGTAHAIGVLENAWTTDRGVLSRARALELSAWTFHLAGRAGVLGDELHSDALAAALGTIAPDALRTGWEEAQRVGPVSVATARLAACARWGAERLIDVDDRVAELLARVLDGADATAMPLFAATRRLASEVIGEAAACGRGAAVALRSHALAEYRSGAMLIACRAVGLTPLEALVAAPEGEQEAIACGWSPPFPARLTVLRRYAAACALADRITGSAYAVLDSGERVELVERLRLVASAVTAP